MASTEPESSQTTPPASELANLSTGENDSELANLSKKQAKKEAQKAERHRKQEEAAAAVAESAEADPFSRNYGDVPTEEIQSKAVSGRQWTEIGSLNAELAERTILIRGAAQIIRPVSKKMAFLVLRQYMTTVQCVLVVNKEYVSPQMVKFATALSKESIVDVEGVVSIPKDPIKGTTQQEVIGEYLEPPLAELHLLLAKYWKIFGPATRWKIFGKVEVQVRKLYCINRAVPNLPINIEDAARSETEYEKAEQTGEQLVRVGQDTRLNYRVLDLRTPANLAIFHIQSHVANIFRRFLLSEGFFEIHTPKLVPGSSEGGAAVFKLDYKGQPACLAQSPQLYKQMAICGGFGRVFEVGPVFRAEDSYTHRHLCEFVGLDVEMEIKEHYFEVCDIVDRLFVAMFDYLNENCKKELDAINKQYPFEPLKYLRNTLRLPFLEGIKMLKEAGVEVDPFGDLNTEAEKKLGRLVREKYDTDFYILYRYPLAVRPFYTMPCYDDPKYSNSFDVFVRGEEIISGAQRVHLPELLTQRAVACKIDDKTISTYIDSFRYGAPPHGGFGVGLERVVMLFCALNNIRKTSLFPRDPQRLVP